MKTLFKINMKNWLLVSIFIFLYCSQFISSNTIRKLETNSSSTGTGTTISTITPNSPQDDPTKNVTKSDIAPVNPGIEINNTLIINKTENIVYEDKLPVNIYNSTLTKEQRDEYLFWVKYKNSFNTQAGQLAKMTKYFAPEDPEYYEMVFSSGWPFYALGGLFTLALLIYLIFRFLFKKFLGPKSHITNFFGYFSWALISKKQHKYDKLINLLPIFIYFSYWFFYLHFRFRHFSGKQHFDPLKYL
jgi:hypothetical protein